MIDALDDGHTHLVSGYKVRTLHEDDRVTAAEIMQEAGVEAMETWLFQSPRYIDDSMWPTESSRCDMLRAMMDHEQDLGRLKSGVQFLIDHPELANRDCNTCRKYWFNHSEGTVPLGPDDKPLLREDYAPPSCETEVGCLKGHWKAQNTLSGIEKKVHDHFLEWRYVGCPLPSCPVMRSNWNALERIYRATELQEACQRILRQPL